MRPWETQALLGAPREHTEGRRGRWMSPDISNTLSQRARSFQQKLSVMTESPLPGMNGESVPTPTLPRAP